MNSRLASRWPSFVIPAVIFLIALNLLFANLDSITELYFDEVTYVAAARHFFHGDAVNENWTHPPFAKFLIGLGMWLLGENPSGWRGMSALAGAGVIWCIFHLAKALFKDTKDAVLAAALCFLNQMLFVQARIAMLDVFMFFFVSLGLLKIWRATENHPGIGGFGAGIAFGCGIACKWFAIFPLLHSVAWIAFSRKTGLRTKRIMILIVSTLSSYFAVFAFCLTWLRVRSSLFGVTDPGGLAIPQTQALQIGSLLPLQGQMLVRQIGFLNPKQPYASAWTDWPLMLRPIWFLRKDYAKSVQAVGMIGNPVILLGGIGGVLVCLWAAFRFRDRVATYIASVYLTLFASWAFFPGHLMLFYYYFPAACFLSLALVHAFRTLKIPPWAQVGFLGASAGIFIFFYPVLAGLPITQAALHRRIWLSSWL